MNRTNLVPAMILPAPIGPRPFSVQQLLDRIRFHRFPFAMQDCWVVAMVYTHHHYPTTKNEANKKDDPYYQSILSFCSSRLVHHLSIFDFFVSIGYCLVLHAVCICCTYTIYLRQSLNTPTFNRRFNSIESCQRDVLIWFKCVTRSLLAFVVSSDT